MRARIVSACAGGESDVEVADWLELDRDTIRKWRYQIRRERWDGFLVRGDQIEALIRWRTQS